MASRGINKVILVGNLGQDPVISQSSSGNMVANVSIATSVTWLDKHTGQKNERTEWHRIVFFQKLAEIVQKYLKKGSKIYVEGSLRTEKWTDNNGQDKYTTKIIANEMQMLDAKQDIDNRQQEPMQNISKQPVVSDEFEDDIPF